MLEKHKIFSSCVFSTFNIVIQEEFELINFDEVNKILRAIRVDTHILDLHPFFSYEGRITKCDMWLDSSYCKFFLL